LRTRLKALFQRYADQHLRLELGGFPLSDGSPGQGPAGHVDRIEVRGTRVRVIGWSLADTVTLRWHGGEDSRAPHIPREDVAAAHSTTLYTGFELDGPLGNHPFHISVQAGSRTRSVPLSSLTAKAVRGARRHLAGRFATDILRCGPALLRHGLTRDPAHRATVKRILGLHTVPVAGPLETRLFTVGPEETLTYPDDVPITIVMPVYNALEVTQAALERVARHTDLPWQAIVIEDCSTDPRVRPWLRAWTERQNAAHTGRVHLVENAENLGFIGSVNKGFDLALLREGPVVLLNSDALVPAGWARRLIRPIFRHDNVASVTPMSNDAEILSVPLICTREVLAEGEGEALDALAQQFHPEALLSVLPTGVGFCMAINIAWLRRVARLDTAFGRGYGEEVDWCQRVRALGGRHLGLPGLFVEHRGGESFGAADKLKLITENNALISARYPTYDREVQDFIAADPLITARLALAIRLAAARAGSHPLTIALAHSLGGGAENYLDRRLDQDVARTGAAIVLRVGGPQRWQIELITPRGRISGATEDFAFVEKLLAPLAARHILYSCGVGDSDPVGLPEALVALRQGPQDLIEVLFHDYFPLSPSYCLLDKHGMFQGLPEPAQADRAHMHQRPDGNLVDLEGWRTAWGGLLTAADTLVVFSEDSRRLVSQAYPGTADKIVVRPHQLLSEVPRIALPPVDSPLTIGVLGNIGYQKGAAVVQDLARRLEKSGAARLVLVGNIDPAFDLPETIPVCGTYRVSELDQIAARHGITCWLIPSIWPETFSYTTHEALATGLPVWGFDLGAQGEALARADTGHVLPFDPDGDLPQIILDKLGT
jgi:GT2 family glycosyltransferase/glycosyltransferase involved in cell wall biosynthesis